MASYCSQLGIKIKTWFRKIGSRWWYERKRNSGKKENDSHQWNEFLVPLETVAGREKNFSLETQYCKSHSTGFFGDHDLESTARTVDSDSPETVDGEWNRTAGPGMRYLGGRSWPKISAMAVSSCPSRIQTGDWFFPKLDAETARRPEISVDEVPAIDRDTTDDEKPQWTWFPGDDDFREKTPENHGWDIGSFRDQAARSVEYAVNYPDDTGRVDQRAVSSQVWNQSNSCRHSSNLHPTLDRDPARLEAAERMLKDIIFENQETDPNPSDRISGTRPIVIEGGKAGRAHSSTHSDTSGTGLDWEMRKTRCVSDTMWKTNWSVDRQTFDDNSGQLSETLAESSNILEKKLQSDELWCQIST